MWICESSELDYNKLGLEIYWGARVYDGYSFFSVVVAAAALTKRELHFCAYCLLLLCVSGFMQCEFARCFFFVCILIQLGLKN